MMTVPACSFAALSSPTGSAKREQSSSIGTGEGVGGRCYHQMFDL